MGVPPSEDAKEYMRKAWLSIKKKLPQDEHPKAKKVLYDAQQMAIQDKNDWIQFPKIRWTYTFCNDLEAKERARTDLQKALQKALDEPWSLAASIKHGIPPEATNDLLQAWRCSLAIGHPLTIREARWIAWLLPTPIMQKDSKFESVRIMSLIDFSRLYAELEWDHEIMVMPCNTSHIDMHFMTDSEFQMALIFGVPMKELTKIPEWRDKTGRFMYTIKIAFPRLSPGYVSRTAGGTVVRDLGLVKDEEFVNKAVESINDFLLASASPFEADILFAYSLRFLSKGPQWEKLPNKEKENVVLSLIAWMKQTNGQPPIDPGLLELAGYEKKEDKASLYFRLWEYEYRNLEKPLAASDSEG